jgi:hypothetical protein
MGYNKIMLLGGEYNGTYVDVPDWLYALEKHTIKGYNNIVDFPVYGIIQYQRENNPIMGNIFVYYNTIK